MKFVFLVEDELRNAYSTILTRTIDEILEDNVNLTRPAIKIRRFQQGQMSNEEKIKAVIIPQLNVITPQQFIQDHK